ncbi:MAG: ATP-binding protein [Coriobacteriales bacterium]|jgi:AAA15 family ATPase/GTPase|nr:ATP-binding protein [Coriobacteriales bacterium]
MLIEFSVKNFKSLRDEQTLSLVASNYYSELNESLIRKELPGLSNLNYLPCSVILGANASGKTSMIQALGLLQQMIQMSFSQQPGNGLLYSPYRLGKDMRTKPTEYHLTFVAQEVRFEYFLSHNRTTVLEESLSAYPKGRQQQWYSRHFDQATNRTKMTTHPTYLDVPSEITGIVRDDALFLSLLIRLNHSGVQQVAHWFADQLAIIDRAPEVPQDLLRNYSTNLLDGESGTDEMRSKFTDIIKKADFGIVKSEVVSAPAPEFLTEIVPMLSPDMLEQLKNQDWKTVQFTHQGQDAVHQFGYDEESAGTRRLFELAGPIVDVLENGKTVLIDELDASMHPLLVQELVRLFQNSLINKSGAQLIFTAHDTTVLEYGLLRRDQIWFIKKRYDGSSLLYPLSDYKPRKKETVADGYLVGRYDAVPAVPRFFGLEQGKALS